MPGLHLREPLPGAHRPPGRRPGGAAGLEGGFRVRDLFAGFHLSYSLVTLHLLVTLRLELPSTVRWCGAPHSFPLGSVVDGGFLPGDEAWPGAALPRKDREGCAAG